MRVHTSSTGLDVRALTPGTDLVLALDETHGLDLPAGVLAHDYLDMDTRAKVDAATPTAFAAWREACDPAFTVDGVCLPWIWEEYVYAFFLSPALRDAVGIVRAVREHGPELIELADGDPVTAGVVRAAAAAAGVRVAAYEAPTGGGEQGREERPVSAVKRVRRAAVRLATRFGFPTLLRDRSVLFLSYWPTVPLFDRLVEESGRRPAVSLQSLPPGPARSLKAAVRGGWVGMPGPRDRAAARRAIESVIRDAGPPPRVEAMGIDLGPALHAHMLEQARSRGALDVANAALFRRAFRGGAVQGLVVAYDVAPHSRLVVSLAREAGVPSLLVEHGAYVLPRTITDMEVSDELALWSEEVAPPFHRNGRPVHEVGFPLAIDPSPTRALRPDVREPRVVILGQGEDPYTMLIDGRIRMRHYCAAVAAVSERLPQARVILRPHPSDALGPLAEVQRRFGDRVEVDWASNIHELAAGCDLCIGSASTATFQAALEGAPVIVLNLTGFEWGWPLGGDTSVPVARSADELGGLLDLFASGDPLPGQEDLVRAVGAGRRDTTDRLLERVAAWS